MPRSAQTFDEWMRLVNRTCYNLAGVTTEDIADYDYMIAFEEGELAHEVAQQALDEAGFPFDEDDTFGPDEEELSEHQAEYDQLNPPLRGELGSYDS